MSRVNLQDRLKELGLDAGHAHLLVVVPLVEVAWADGEVQSAERALIVEVAERFGLLDETCREILDGWLSKRPSGFYLKHARAILRELARKARTPDGLEPENVVAWCHAVANAAGGLFGTSFRAVDAREAEAIERIAKQLGVGDLRDWRARIAE